LLVNWMTEMVQGARVGDKGAPTDATQSTPQRSA
jgi:hypothetical protein